jgi:hypothetical protein
VGALVRKNSYPVGSTSSTGGASSSTALAYLALGAALMAATASVKVSIWEMQHLAAS